MERITYRLTLDAHKNGVQKMLQGFQTADNISRRMVICIASGGNTINVDSTDTVAMMYVTTPNATEPSINACTIENNTVIYDVLPIVEAGITEMQIKLIETTSSGAEKVLATPKFAIEVSQSGMDDSGAEQTTTFTALEQAIAQANGVYNERLIRVDFTEDCVFQAYYADGTIYENDSFKVVLSDFVANAKESEYNAYVAEMSAKASAINAKASESNAKVSEKNAKVSEANAKRYMENALNATPEGYSLLDIQETTNTTLENSKAGGLKLVSMRGKTVQNSTVGGKNLLNVPSTFTGTTLEVEVDLKAGVTYTLSCSAVSDSISGNLYDASGIHCGFLTLAPMPPIIGGTAVTPEGAEDTFTPKSDVAKIELGGTKEEFTIYNLQLEEGAEATEYVPYDGTVPSPSMDCPQPINRARNVIIKTHGKNFIKCNGVNEKEMNGITFTKVYNPDGTLAYISARGTATADAYMVVAENITLDAGTYNLNGCPVGGGDTTFKVLISGGSYPVDFGNGSTVFTLKEKTTFYNVAVWVGKGQTVHGIKFKPMIRIASESEIYQPYMETIATIQLSSGLAEDDSIDTRDGKIYEHRKQGLLLINENSDVTLYGANEYGITHFELVNQSIKNDSTNCYCSHFKKSLEGSNTKQEGFFISEKSVYFRVFTSRFSTAEEFKEWLADNPMLLVYNLQTETDTELSDDVQMEINGLETFDEVTYVTVDSAVKLEILSQYGTSRVGAITLKNELRLNNLEL